MSECTKCDHECHCEKVWSRCDEKECNCKDCRCVKKAKELDE